MRVGESDIATKRQDKNNENEMTKSLNIWMNESVAAKLVTLVSVCGYVK